MAKTCFSVDGVTFPHLRVLGLTQTFEILDGENSGRVMTGEMTRDIIGTYFNYKVKIKPEESLDGMREYNKLWDMCSSPTDSHTLVFPFDIGSNGVVHSTLTFMGYITSGSRDMIKYDLNSVDYWKDGDFQFVAMKPERTPV